VVFNLKIMFVFVPARFYILFQTKQPISSPTEMLDGSLFVVIMLHLFLGFFFWEEMECFGWNISGGEWVSGIQTCQKYHHVFPEIKYEELGRGG